MAALKRLQWSVRFVIHLRLSVHLPCCGILLRRSAHAGTPDGANRRFLASTRTCVGDIRNSTVRYPRATPTTNENGLPSGKPLICLVAGARNVS
jgi:hypothetical protein